MTDFHCPAWRLGCPRSCDPATASCLRLIQWRAALPGAGEVHQPIDVLGDPEGHRMSRPRVLDLFCGAGGGWSLGLHWAGYHTVAACEADPWRREVFGLNNPRVKMYGDIRTLTASRFLADGVVPDIVAGSPPCQDISCANPSGRGVDGERSGLFFEAIRIVAELARAGHGPRWVCLENSPRLLNRGIDRVLDALDEAGYTGRPLVVGAADLGAPHIRRRCWIVANAHGVGELQPGGGVREIGGRPGDGGSAPGAAPDAGRIGRLSGRMGGSAAGPGGMPTGGRAGDGRYPWVDGPPAAGRVDDGVPAGVAARCVAAYGDAVVPQIAEMIGRAILAVDPGMGRRVAA